MVNFTTLFAKISQMRDYCLEQSEIDCEAGQVNDSKTAYNDQFNDLVFAINGYKLNISYKQSQMLDIIMMDFANTIIGDINYTPPIYKPEAPFPEGYSDYWDLYNINGLADEIMNWPVDHFYEDCIISPTGTTPNLQAAISAATGAEAAEALKRQTLIEYVRTFPQINALIYLTENFTITGTPKAKTQVGDIIYNQKHAKQIIDTYGLEVYIPSYIV